MCGIAGIIGRGATAEVAQAMADRLAHRGPDGEGNWLGAGVALAHRRLAILDVSIAGAQPMQFGSHVLVYNGELYNFQALRARLPGPFHSNCDTEVLLQLLAKDGSKALRELVGMFAFAVWDSERRHLFAARDRLGIKPFYYRLLADGIAFASELKALLVLGTPPIDKSAVSIRIGTVDRVRSDFANSKPVSPGMVTSRIRRSKLSPSSLARASATASAVVTR